MSDTKRMREDIREWLEEYISQSENVGFCDNCPNLRYHRDIGCYDCPDGLAVDSCEYSPDDTIDELTDIIVSEILGALP